MIVLPVLDVQHGQVVRGVAGNRTQYRPIDSRLTADTDPASVARALAAHFGCRDIYLADLDAIQGKDPNWKAYESVAECGLELIIDAGITSSERLEELRHFASTRSWLTGIVVGLESILHRDFLPEAPARLGAGTALFSLDLKAGRPLTLIEEWRSAVPRAIVAHAIAAGFTRLIVLDLAAVGTGQGPATATLCRELRRAYPSLEIISGGGVRSAADVQAFLDAGCNRVLVASALHDGRLNAIV